MYLVPITNLIKKVIRNYSIVNHLLITMNGTSRAFQFLAIVLVLSLLFNSGDAQAQPKKGGRGGGGRGGRGGRGGSRGGGGGGGGGSGSSSMTAAGM